MRARKISGFGLIEIFVVTVVAIFAFVAVDNLLLTGLNGARTIQSKNDFSTVQQAIKLALSNPLTCANALFNSASPPTRAQFNPVTAPVLANQLSSIQLGSNIVAASGQSFPTFAVTNFVLSEIPSAPRIVGALSTQYSANLHIEVTKTGKTFLNPVMAFDLPLSVTASTDTTNMSTYNQIIACSLTGGGSSSSSTVSYAPPATFNLLSPSADCALPDGNGGWGPNPTGGMGTVYSATAQCPTGTKIVGGGANCMVPIQSPGVWDSQPIVVSDVINSYPDTTNNAWVVQCCFPNSQTGKVSSWWTGYGNFRNQVYTVTGPQANNQAFAICM